MPVMKDEFGLKQIVLELPKATPDQIEYLERIRRAGEDYDGSQIVGGPKKEKAMSGTFWVIETARQTYWDGRKGGEQAQFTSKISEAIKFLDSESADRVRCWLLEKPPERGGTLRCFAPSSTVMSRNFLLKASPKCLAG